MRMILALMFTCGCRRSRLCAYLSRSASADGMSVMLMLLVIVSAVTVPRTGQLKLSTTPTCGVGCAAGAPGAAGAPALVDIACAADVGQLRVSRCDTIGATELARA